MRFATLPNGRPDGRLHLVSTDHARAAPAAACATLQDALDDWTAIAPALEAEYALLNSGTASGEIAFDPVAAMAPLPRAWQWLDGSTYASHGELMKQAFGFSADRPDSKPLMYQGISDRFQSPCEAALFPAEEDEIDFEGEFGVILDKVQMGASAATCRKHIRLLVQINDWSLRRLGPVEMKSEFGVLQCKPRCSMAPVAVTPDEIGNKWRDAQIGLTLTVTLNDKSFGRARGDAMSVGFDVLAEHAAYSRELVAGTVIGSGTVSNANYREVGSSCISERRMIEMVDQGRFKTDFLKFGDRVRMGTFDDNGKAVFGAIDQLVAQG